MSSTTIQPASKTQIGFQIIFAPSPQLPCLLSHYFNDTGNTFYVRAGMPETE